MDDIDHALFPRFSAELVATALKDTPVVMVTGPRQSRQDHPGPRFGRGQSRIHHHGRRHGAGCGTQRSNRVRAALDRTTIDDVQRVPDLLRADQEVSG